jgi:hypothetical protein
MIAAYIDESATNSSDPVLSVAITATTENRWEKFEQAWQPRIAHLEKGYHAKRCETLHQDLADLMVAQTLFSSFVTLRESDYHRHFPKWVQSVLGGPYALGVMFGLVSYAWWSRIPDNAAGPAFFFIERGHRGFPQVAQMMSPDTISHLSTKHYGTGSHGAFINQLFDAVCVFRETFRRIKSATTSADSAKLR